VPVNNEQYQLTVLIFINYSALLTDLVTMLCSATEAARPATAITMLLTRYQCNR